MKFNILLTAIFLSVILYANINESTGIIGLTLRDGNDGCACHNIEPSANVNVWIEGPDTVVVSDTVDYKIFMNGGPSVEGGFNVAVYYGVVDSADSLTQTLPFFAGGEQLTHTMPRPFGNATVFWDFKYTAPDSVVVDTIYSVANSVNGDGNPIPGDEWNFGANFPVTIVEEIIPVEFISFNAVSDRNTISLTWTTATETNNYGFEVQLSNDNLIYSTIGFVKGNGTTTETNDYSFKDKFSKQGVYNYRLKQIDFDGSFLYSVVIEVNINVNKFSLEQNYPNPFNPSTSIQYAISSRQYVSLKVYDVLGNEVATLVNEEIQAGTYKVEFNATGVPSGIYFYKFKTNEYTQTKKMILLK